MARSAIPKLDPKAEAVLKEIGRKIPRRLVNNLTHEVVDTSQEDAARAALKSTDLPTSTRRKIQKAIRNGQFRTAETIVNEDVAKELDQYHEREVRRAISDGRLPPPREDPLIKERSWRARNNRQ